MDNEELEEDAVWITNTCLRCEKKFRIKNWKLDDARFKRLCSGCKTTIQKKEIGGIADCSLSYF